MSGAVGLHPRFQRRAMNLLRRGVGGDARQAGTHLVGLGTARTLPEIHFVLRSGILSKSTRDCRGAGCSLGKVTPTWISTSVDCDREPRWANATEATDNCTAIRKRQCQSFVEKRLLSAPRRKPQPSLRGKKRRPIPDLRRVESAKASSACRVVHPACRRPICNRMAPGTRKRPVPRD